MINKNNFLYSISAAARILGVKQTEIIRFEEWAYVCFVCVKGDKPTFIGKKKFKKHFAEWRQEKAQRLKVKKQEHQDNIYTVINDKKGTNYDVYVYPMELECSCHDYSNQITMLNNNGIACCKHCYAVLNSMGFNKLEDYVNYKKWKLAS